MAKLPRPRTPLTGLDPVDVSILPTGSNLWRIYSLAGEHPTSWNSLRFFGPLAKARFDHHLPPPHIDDARGIIYVAEDPAACCAECFQDTRTIDRQRNAPYLVQFTTAMDVALLDLLGPWPTRAGASQAISTGRRDVTRLWSQAIYDEYPAIQGLIYRSSMLGHARCLALYDRGSGLFPARPNFNRSLLDPGLDAILRRIAATIGYILV